MDAGLTVQVEAPTQTAASMTSAIEQFLHNEAKKK
jgi:hypothetical protein